MPQYNDAAYLEDQLINNPDFDELFEIIISGGEMFDDQGLKYFAWYANDYNKEILIGDKGIVMLLKTTSADEVMSQWIANNKKEGKSNPFYNTFLERSSLKFIPLKFYTIPNRFGTNKTLSIEHEFDTVQIFSNFVDEIKFIYKSGVSITFPTKDDTIFEIKKENKL